MAKAIFLGLSASFIALSITTTMGCGNDGGTTSTGSSAGTGQGGGATSSGASSTDSASSSVSSGTTATGSGGTATTTTGTTGSGTATTGSAGSGTATTGSGTGGMGTGGSATSTTGSSTASSATSSSSSSGSGGGPPGGPEPDPVFIPAPTGPCPNFVEGIITVTPDGKPRNVQIWISSAASTLDGPLIFYWHGTGSSPVTEPPYGIGASNVTAIKAQGGIIAAPYHDPAAGTFPWFLTSGNGPLDDLRVADEVLACAIQKVGIDKRHIHSMGMSAGGLHTTQMSYRRAGYLASVVTYSGGLLGNPPNQAPSNKLAAMIFHGGPSDMVFINFQTVSVAYRDALKNAGHFAFICNHNMGHAIPTGAVNSVRQFFEDHPFGTVPSPYAGGLPIGFPSYCSL